MTRRSNPRLLRLLTCSLLAAACLLAGGLTTDAQGLRQSATRTQQPTRGFVPRHEQLIQQARQRASEDWAQAVRAEGRERPVVSRTSQPVGSGVRRATSRVARAQFTEGLEELPYHEPMHELPPHGAAPLLDEPYLDEPYHDEMPIDDGLGGCAECCGGCGAGACGGYGGCGVCGMADCGGCSGCMGGCVGPCCCGVSLFRRRVVDVFIGSQAFTGSMNRGSTGSFGFHEGFNCGTQLPFFGGQWGAQLSARAVHANFSGSDFTTETRNQLFLTTGIYRRMDYGLQGGLVVDYLTEDWYASTDLLQLRGEAGIKLHEMGDLGFLFRVGVSESTIPPIAINNLVRETVEPTDVYALYYRHEFCGGGQARLLAGFSEHSDGLLGVDARVPLTGSLSAEGGMAYLVPDQTRRNGLVEESWNLYLSLVWRPGCQDDYQRYYQPLFRVADNGTFFVNRR